MSGFCIGVIEAGSIVALMGPSGSGKTTLLDCLSGKKRRHEGEVFLDGVPRVYRHLKQVATYVPQVQPAPPTTCIEH